MCTSLSSHLLPLHCGSVSPHFLHLHQEEVLFLHLSSVPYHCLLTIFFLLMVFFCVSWLSHGCLQLNSNSGINNVSVWPVPFNTFNEYLKITLELELQWKQNVFLLFSVNRCTWIWPIAGDYQELAIQNLIRASSLFELLKIFFTTLAILLCFNSIKSCLVGISHIDCWK